jgi:trehalose 6-phosphate phosphatase
MTTISDTLQTPKYLGADAALFLDLDGTLVDFAARPEEVVVQPGVVDALAALHEALDGALAIVSGRALAQIDALIRLPMLAAAGLHGSELRLADGRLAHDKPPFEALASVRARAIERASKLDGVFVEDKGIAIAIHYRGAPAAAEAVAALADELQGMAGSGFERQNGNHVVELKPSGRDKGVALAMLMATPPFSGRRPWMIGDDLTDEHAFVAANAGNGISAIVGSRRPTAAHYAFRDPSRVREWLVACVRALRTPRQGNDP